MFPLQAVKCWLFIDMIQRNCHWKLNLLPYLFLGSFPHCSNDGSWLCLDQWDQSVFHGICQCSQFVGQDCCCLSALLGTGAEKLRFVLVTLHIRTSERKLLHYVLVTNWFSLSTAVFPTSLWLWNASRQICSHSSWKFKAEVSRPRRGHSAS